MTGCGYLAMQKETSMYVALNHNVCNLVYHFVTTVGKNTNENVIKEYVKNQGQNRENYKQIQLFRQ